MDVQPPLGATAVAETLAPVASVHTALAASLAMAGAGPGSNLGPLNVRLSVAEGFKRSSQCLANESKASENFGSQLDMPSDPPLSMLRQHSSIFDAFGIASILYSTS
jgi:hypothetical protein